MIKILLFFMLFSYVFISDAYAVSNQGIAFNELPVSVRASAREYFRQEDIAEVNISHEEEPQYSVSGDIAGTQTTIVFSIDGSVISVKQTFLKQKEMGCEDVKQPVLTDDEQYYLQVEGLIQKKPIRRCDSGKPD